MAHRCITCGSICHCNGDIDDLILGETFDSCDCCAEGGEWPEDDEEYFDECADCDGHPACADFGCAIQAGIRINKHPL